MKILACNSNKELAEAISSYIGVKLADATIRKFSDDEILYAIKLLRDCDFAFKNTSMDERYLAHSILAGICGRVNA